MNLLAIETSTTKASIALKIDNQIWEREEDSLTKHAEWALVAIDELLLNAGVSMAELDGIVFDKGPGSFTGLRIGCSIAKGLSLGTSLPIFPVGSLNAIAYTAQKYPHLLVMLDARMEEWYWTWFESGKQMSEIQVSAPNAIPCLPTQPFWLVGVGFEEGVLNLPMEIKAQLLGKQEVYPMAKSLIEVVLLEKIQPVSALEAHPMYVRNKVASTGVKRG